MIPSTIAFSRCSRTVFEGLLTFDAKFQVVPQLAERWEASPDGKVYTFTLRKGVKFHNGREMTAEDVKTKTQDLIAGLYTDVTAHFASLGDDVALKVFLYFRDFMFDTETS